MNRNRYIALLSDAKWVTFKHQPDDTRATFYHAGCKTGSELIDPDEYQDAAELLRDAGFNRATPKHYVDVDGDRPYDVAYTRG